MNHVASIQTSSRISGLIPTSIDEVFRLAKGVAASGLAPSGMKTPEQVAVAIMHGLEIGLPPMQAIQRIAVIHGRPTIWGDAIPALLLSHGFRLEEKVEDEAAECTLTRPNGDVITRRFTKADAEKADLWAKAGTWQQYPKRMLQMRARALAARDGAADVLSGLYLREELDEPMRDITPVAARSLPEPPEVPDIPDLDVDQDPPLADESHFIDKLAGEIVSAGTPEIINEVEEHNADMIARCSEAGQAEIAELFEGARQ